MKKQSDRSIKDVCEEIKSRDFDFTAGQAAGLNMFKRIVRRSNVYQELMDLIENSKNNQLHVRLETLTLASKKFDVNYENPYDVPIATFILALYDSNCLIDYLLNRVNNTEMLWWAKKLVREISSEKGDA